MADKTPEEIAESLSDAQRIAWPYWVVNGGGDSCSLWAHAVALPFVQAGLLTDHLAVTDLGLAVNDVIRKRAASR